ncbi:MAG: TolC family protein [Prevotella sp.]|nr:TolC family protein [Prevotella sp.]
MRRKLLTSVVILTTLIPAAYSQRQWTLRQCADYAIDHNISIRQRINVERQQDLQLSTAKNSRLPNLNFSAGENLSFGRAQTINGTYSNRNTNNTSFGLNTSVPLFTGFNIPNQIKLNQLNLDAAVQDLEKARNDIRMQVAKAYVQILYDKEMAGVAHRQITIDSIQVARLQGLFKNGKASQTDLSQQQASLAKSHLTATQADNTHKLSLLTLSQLLELSTPEGFDVVSPNVERLADFTSLVSPEIIYQEALAIKPEIQAEMLRLRGTDHSIKIAQSALYPTLSFNGGLQTNYFKTNGVSADPFFRQMKNNFAQHIGVSLSYTLFNRLATRNNIRKARIDRENQQLVLDNTKKTLYKEIQQAYYNAVAAHYKYESSQAAAKSSKDAFTLMQAKYENGMANITQFDEAKNKYLNAESDLVQARYEYLYQTALMNFYRGKELDF